MIAKIKRFLFGSDKHAHFAGVLSYNDYSEICPAPAWKVWLDSLERRPCKRCGTLTVFRMFCGDCDDLQTYNNDGPSVA